jgi:hypothetical protein
MAGSTVIVGINRAFFDPSLLKNQSFELFEVYIWGWMAQYCLP